MYGQSSSRVGRQDGINLNGTHSSKGPPYGSRTLPSGTGYRGGQERSHRRHHSVSTPSTGSMRSPSPMSMTLPVEHMQSVSAAYSMSQSYLPEYPGDEGSDSRGSPSFSQGLSPFQSPSHSRSSSMTSIRSQQTNKSADQYQHSGSLRDRSLDRQMDRFNRDDRRINTRDRSTDRDYPHMGARSLDRNDHFHSGLYRSRSIDHEQMLAQSYFSSAHDVNPTRDALILDMQTQIAELNKECASMQQDLDTVKEKLSSSMNSIKNFWSPELKKERALRREETARTVAVSEQLKQAQQENQKHKTTIEEMEGRLQEVSDCVHQLNGLSSEDTAGLQQERERQANQLLILQKTVEEMELRIETQKQTLQARDESIKKLLEMLQSKGLAVQQLEDDRLEMERLRTRTLEQDRQLQLMQTSLSHKEREIADLKEEAAKASSEMREAQSQYELNKKERLNVDALNALVETKESRIQGLELQIHNLEAELSRMKEEISRREEGIAGDPAGQDKAGKAKVDELRAEVLAKETDLCSLKTRLETMERQVSDKEHYVLVLREQISAKEKQASMLQADIDILRGKISEKESELEAVRKSLTSAQTEKKRIEGELVETQEHMEIKDRKILVLQRKIDNLEEMMKDKEAQLDNMKSRLISVQVDQSSSDSALSSLEESISDKDRQIDRLREQKERADREHIEETEHFQATNQELRRRQEELQRELDSKQDQVLQLREEVAELTAHRTKKDSQVKQLELQLTEKNTELNDLQVKVQKLEDEQKKRNETPQQSPEEMEALRSRLKEHEDSVNRTQVEVDRLLGILKETEEEKHKKDEQIKELQDQLKEYRQKVGTLKRNQQTEKKKNAQLLEEARKREGSASDDVSQLKTTIRQKGERIEELEEALRESVKITAQREMVMASQQVQLEESKKELDGVADEVSKAREVKEKAEARITELNSQLAAKDKQLQALESQKEKQMKDVYKMKQEAILAAISEKDANIALLELTSTKKQRYKEQREKLAKEKEGLQQQLKDLDQKLLQGQDKRPNGENQLVKRLQSAPKEQ